jgi:hypothetical protein
VARALQSFAKLDTSFVKPISAPRKQTASGAFSFQLPGPVLRPALSLIIREITGKKFSGAWLFIGTQGNRAEVP